MTTFLGLPQERRIFSAELAMYMAITGDVCHPAMALLIDRVRLAREQVGDGLQVGDMVILSDMSNFEGVGRTQMK